MSSIIDLVPEERRSPALVDRALLVEESRPQLEELIYETLKKGEIKLGELALVLAEDLQGNWSAFTLTRKKCKELLERHRPHPHPKGYLGFDAPEGFVVVAVVGAKGGVTITGMGIFRTPDGANKGASAG